MDNAEILLSEHPFFQGLTPDRISVLARISEAEPFSAGKYIFREGDAASAFYLIRNGKVAVEVFAAQRGALTIQTIDTGDVLGWSWLVPPHRWRFSARAIDLVRTIRLEGDALLQLCQSDHELGYQVLNRLFQVVAQRLEATRLQLMDIYGIHS